MKIEMEGFRELERALAEDLPKATAKNVLRRSAKNAMKPLEERARQLVRKDTGETGKSITTKSVRASRFATHKGIAVETGPTGRQEGGTGARLEFGSVTHPAYPFMRPAADAEGLNVLKSIKGDLTEQIDKAKARIARKAARAAKG